MQEKVPKTVILNYHNIMKSSQELSADKGCISIDLFKDQIDTLEREGFKNVSLEQAFMSLIENNDGAIDNSYAITFDDGYENLIEFLPPFLDKIKPTIFHITEYTGISNMVWNTRTPEIQQHLNLEQLKELKKLGVDIQLHGIDHHNLIKFRETDLRKRFEQGIEWFEEKLGSTPVYLSYPYGYCNELIEKIGAEYFRGAVTVSHGKWFGKDARFALNRLGVSNFLTGKDLVDVIRTVPENRWYVKEQKAPWNRGKTKTFKKNEQ